MESCTKMWTGKGKTQQLIVHSLPITFFHSFSQHGETALDRRGLPGWDKVDRLAAVLLETRGLSVSGVQANRIRELWSTLDPMDRRPLEFGGLPRRTRVRGRFQRRYRTGGHVGVEAVGR